MLLNFSLVQVDFSMSFKHRFAIYQTCSTQFRLGMLRWLGINHSKERILV